MPVLEYLVVATALVLMPWLAARLLADGPDLPDPRATFEAARARHTRRVLTAALLRHGDVDLPVLAGTTGPSRTVGRVVPLRDPGRRRVVPGGQPHDRLHDLRVARQRAQLRLPGRAGPQQRRADPRREELRVQQHGVVLDPLDVARVELAVPQRRLERLGDPAGAQPVVAGVEVVDPAVRPELVERVVVQRGAGRVVVRADEEPVARVDRVRHLGHGQDLVRQRLARVVVHGRQPLVAARPVPHQVRRAAVDVAGLQVLAQRQLAAGEVRDVAAAVRVRPVLRADVERPQALLEVGQVLRAHPGEERVELLGRRVPGVLDRQRGAGRLVKLHDRAVVAARHDQRRGRDPVARRDDRDLAAVVGPERLRDRLHRLQPSLVDGGQPAG